MDITKYLNTLGYDTVDKSFYSMVNVWRSWYRSNVARFHRYKVYTGNKHITRQRIALGMAKKVSEDIADLLLNERVGITISGDATDDYVKKILKDNNWDTLGNEYQERKAACGTVAYVPYIDSAEVDEDGNVVAGSGTVKIDYVTAPNIFPLSWANGVISECAFVFPKKCKNKDYALVQIHTLESDEYVIYNHVVECTKGAGTEIDPTKWKDIKPFAALSPTVHTDSDKRQYVIDKLNIVNNFDEDNPMGIAIFANAVDQLKGCDTTYDSYVNEFVLGKKRIFAGHDVMGEDIEGNPVFDPDDVCFYKLPAEMMETGKPIIESNMELRSEEHNKALNDHLNMLSMKCGFGTEHYKFDNGNITTATQVISENSDMYRTIKKHEIVLDSVIKELIQIICRLGNVLGANVNEDPEITIDFDDSIIEDKGAERLSDRQDVSMGVMSHAEYRAKYYNETLEDATKNLPPQANVVME